MSYGADFYQSTDEGDTCHGYEKRDEQIDLEKDHKRIHEHSAKRYKFTLGEINDSRGIMDDVKSHGHNGVNGPNGQTGDNILSNLLGKIHYCSKNPGTEHQALICP